MAQKTGALIFDETADFSIDGTIMEQGTVCIFTH